MNDKYFYKQLNAENRMKLNSLVNGLSDEQHDALSKLCSIRHKMHCMDCTRVYNSESIEHSEYAGLYDSINDILLSSDMPGINFTICSDDLIDDMIADIDGIEYNEAIDALANMMNTINNQIEGYLREIDNKYKTQYAPAGLSRIY